MKDVSPKGVTALRFWRRGGGHDRNIIGGDEVWQKINYIHLNPVGREAR